MAKGGKVRPGVAATGGSYGRASSRTRPGRGPGPTSRRNRRPEPLDGTAIKARINPQIRQGITRLEVLEETSSTNDVLLHLPSGEIHGRVVLAERQTAGKGRRGRSWQSPEGNISLSLGWQFAGAPSSLAALGPVVGVCLCRALDRIGLSGHGVKWPNDIQLGGAKLCGILVELRGGRQGCEAVIGIGVNVRLGAAIAAGIDQPCTDLVSALGAGVPERDRIVAALIEELLQGIGEFERSPQAFLAATWPAWDLLRGRRVRVERGDRVFEGRAEGISANGALRLRLDSDDGSPAANGIMEFHSGEVSVRRG